MTLFPVSTPRWLVCLFGILAITTILFAPAPSPSAVAAGQEKPPRMIVIYTLTPYPEKTPPQLNVEMQISTSAPVETLRVQMPTWSPGDYHVQNHARFVQDVKAAGKVTLPRESGGLPDVESVPLPVEKEDANTWRIETRAHGTVHLTYTVQNSPPGFFSENVRVDSKTAFVNGPAALMYVVGHKETVGVIQTKVPSDWRAVVPLPRVPSDTRSKTQANLLLFNYDGYDELADSPIVMAHKDALIVKEFTMEGKPHQAVFFRKIPTEAEAEASLPMLKKIVQAESKIMGGLPYKQYAFLFDMGGRGGGLEHLNSSRMAMRGAPGQGAAGFIAHEFFHLWNVKRIRPRVLGPFDYITPPKTRNLWFAEGVTEYFAEIAIRRAGLSTEAQFLDHWRGATQWFQQVPARKRVSADESSLRVWEANNSSGYGGLNYYQKGELIGLCLDLKIRHVTGNRHSLDDVMRELFKRTNPPKPGFGEDEIREVVNLIAGQDLSAFYDLLARSTEELPFAECFSYAGLDAACQPLPNATAAQVALRKSWMQSW